MVANPATAQRGKTAATSLTFDELIVSTDIRNLRRYWTAAVVILAAIIRSLSRLNCEAPGF
jgi:hypothetical protein